MMTLGYEFCNWDCRSWGDLVIILVNLGLATLLLAYVIYIFVQSRNKHNLKSQAEIYILMLLWGIFFLGSSIFSVIMFTFLYKTEQWRGSITLSSRVYSVTNALPAVFILVILSYLPYKMMRNLEEKLSKHNQVLVWKSDLIRNAIIIKPIPTCLCFILFVLSLDVYTYDLISEIKYAALMFDCLCTVCILCYARHVILSAIENKTVEGEGATVMKSELFWLTFSGFSRLLISLFFYLVMPALPGMINLQVFTQQDRLFPEVRCLDAMSNHYEYSFAYLMLGTWVMHFLPIYMASTMYHPDEEANGKRATKKQSIFFVQ